MNPSKKIDIRLPVEARNALDELAKQDKIAGEKTSAADHVRAALKLYFSEKKLSVSTDVQEPGGDRRSEQARTRTA